MPLARRTVPWLAVSLLASATALGVAAPAGAGERTGITEHTVAAGENLTRIAARYCTSVSDVVERNAVTDPHLIHAGTRLAVADRCAAPAASAAASAGAAPPATDATGPAEVRTELHLVARFRAAAEEFGVPGDLLMALTYTESRWRSDRVSADGAIGIGQLLPATASWLRDLMGEPRLDEAVPADNVRMSARLLRFLLDRTATSSGTRTRVALAAYYQGIGDVLRNGVDRGGNHYADVVLERRPWFAEL